MAGKLIIFSAPSGSGKSTIINYLLKQDLHLRFSISATSRAPRGTEKNGVEYYFLTPEEFRSRIANGDFLEYEEVYTDKYYGTLKSEVERILNEGDNVIFDVDGADAISRNSMETVPCLSLSNLLASMTYGSDWKDGEQTARKLSKAVSPRLSMN